MTTKNIYIKTYGCQMNVEDSHRMAEIMQPQGYKINNNLDEADIVVLNTCHIREKATEKLYSELGKIRDLKKQKQNNLIIVVAGCVSQAEGEEIFNRANYVDIVVGPQAYNNLPDMVNKVLREKQKNLINLDFTAESKFDALPEEKIPQGVSAFLTVQEGCDKFCTFCVVPYTRGAEYSRPVNVLYREALQLAKQGAKEITLLGQNVTAYHGDSPEGEQSLAKLIKLIASIDEIERIRYTTSHPRDMTDELIELHGTEPKLMPYLHLPVQSGSNNILKKMNRKHDRDFYFKIIEKFRKARPDMAFSSDFIVGFPEETDQDFRDTMELIEEVKFAHAYSFKYSIRPGTPAGIQEVQLDEKIKDERLQELQALLRKQQQQFNNQFQQVTMPVLFDKKGRYSGQVIGKSPYLQSVHINEGEQYLNTIQQVKIQKIHSNSLAGQIIKADEPITA